MEGYIYLVSRPRFAENVYKLGMSSSIHERLKTYGDKRFVHVVRRVDDRKKSERRLLELFSKEFELVDGRETFRGDLKKMKEIIECECPAEENLDLPKKLRLNEYGARYTCPRCGWRASQQGNENVELQNTPEEDKNILEKYVPCCTDAVIYLVLSGFDGKTPKHKWEEYSLVAFHSDTREDFDWSTVCGVGASSEFGVVEREFKENFSYFEKMGLLRSERPFQS